MALAPDHLGPTITVGEILVEIMATSVGDGFREPIDLVGPFASGAPAIFTDQCARIGGSAAIVGAVGADDFGRLNVDRLARDGADVSAIAVDPDYPTGSAFVRYRADGSRDFVYNIATSAAARFGWSKAVEALVAKAGHIHVMGSALSMPSAVAVTDRAVRIVKERGGSLSFDPNLRKELKYDAETERRFAELVAARKAQKPERKRFMRDFMMAKAEGATEDDKAILAEYEAREPFAPTGRTSHGGAQAGDVDPLDPKRVQALAIEKFSGNFARAAAHLAAQTRR